MSPRKTTKLFPRDNVHSFASGVQQQNIYVYINISMPKQSVYRHKYNMYYYKWKKFAVNTNVFNILYIHTGPFLVASAHRTHTRTHTLPRFTNAEENVYQILYTSTQAHQHVS